MHSLTLLWSLNYSLSIKKLGVRYWGKNLKDQRSRGAATSDFVPLQFLPPKGPRSALSTALVLPASYLYSVLQTSVVNFGQLVTSSALWLQANFICQNTTKVSHNTCVRPPVVKCVCGLLLLYLSCTPYCLVKDTLLGMWIFNYFPSCHWTSPTVFFYSAADLIKEFIKVKNSALCLSHYLPSHYLLPVLFIGSRTSLHYQWISLPATTLFNSFQLLRAFLYCL